MSVVDVVWVCFFRLCMFSLTAAAFFVDVFFQAEDGIRDLVRSRGLGDVYKRQAPAWVATSTLPPVRCSAGHAIGRTVAKVASRGASPTRSAVAVPSTSPVSYTHLTLPPSGLV